MTAQDLKNTILQLAMQGKLVPQDPADEPASELLKRICAKKKPRLIDKGTMPIDIPGSWQWSYISDVGELIRGSGIKRNETVDKGFPCIRYGELYTTYEIAFTETVSFIPESIFNRCKQIAHGDLLMTLTGENKPDIAKTIAYIGTTPIAIGGDLAYWTKHGMNPLYLSYLMASPYVIEKKVELATGDRIVHISSAKLGTIPIPIPPLAEQARIVAKIEELLPYIEEYDAAGKRLTALNKKFPDQLRKSILQQAIMGKLTERNPADEPASELLKRIRAEKVRLIKEGKLKKEKPLPTLTEDDYPFDIPDEWEWVRLTDVGEVSRGRSKNRPRNDPSLFERGIYPFIQTGDVAQSAGTILECHSFYNEKGLTQSRMWPKGTLCLTIAANIGDVGILNFDACFPDSVIGFNAFHPIKSNRYFLYMLMAYKAVLDSRATKSAQKNINLDTLASLAYPLPPLAEQQRIVERVEELLAVCRQLSC